MNLELELELELEMDTFRTILLRGGKHRWEKTEDSIMNTVRLTCMSLSVRKITGAVMLMRIGMNDRTAKNEVLVGVREEDKIHLSKGEGGEVGVEGVTVIEVEGEEGVEEVDEVE